MELKKNPKADLGRRKFLFLEIGLVISLGLVIAAFGVSQKEKKVEVFDLGTVADEIEMIDITKQEAPKEETPVKQSIQVISDILNVVKNDTKITTSFDFAEFDEMSDIDVQAFEIEVTEEEIEEDAPFLTAEVMPSFKGGTLADFRTWVMERLKYPVIAQENGISGRVVAQFVIERDGSLSNIQILQSPDRSLSEETTRVLQSSPKWSPGKQRNVACRVKYILPVEFTISD